MKTRYRILSNGLQYKVQHQHFSRTIFGHWKRKWVDTYDEFIMFHCVQCVYVTLYGAKCCIDNFKYKDILQREEMKRKAKIKKLNKNKNSWVKVWP